MYEDYILKCIDLPAITRFFQQVQEIPALADLHDRFNRLFVEKYQIIKAGIGTTRDDDEIEIVLKGSEGDIVPRENSALRVLFQHVRIGIGATIVVGKITLPFPEIAVGDDLIELGYGSFNLRESLVIEFLGNLDRSRLLAFRLYVRRDCFLYRRNFLIRLFFDLFLRLFFSRGSFLRDGIDLRLFLVFGNILFRNRQYVFPDGIIGGGTPGHEGNQKNHPTEIQGNCRLHRDSVAACMNSCQFMLRSPPPIPTMGLEEKVALVRDIHKILHAYAKHTGSPRFSWGNFLTFVRRYAKRFIDERPEMASLLDPKSNSDIAAALSELESARKVELEHHDDGSIASVYYAAFYATEITRWYKKMLDSKDLPFPGEDSFDITIPAEKMQPVEVTENLMHYIEGDEGEIDEILLLKFPYGVYNVVTTTTLLKNTMLALSVSKIRDYLRTGQNAGYMETKMRGIFANREMMVRELIENAHSRPDEAIKTIREPTEFQFHFWTQFSSLIIKEFSQKTEKLRPEHGYCQASFLLGYYSVFYKGRHQQSKKREEIHRFLTNALQKPPYVFTVQDVYALPDDRGIPLTKKVRKEEVNAWLDEMLKRPGERRISELVTINTPEKSGLMVHTGQYIPLLLRHVKAAATVISNELSADMFTVMMAEKKEKWLEDAEAFEAVVAEKVEAEFGLLYGLCTFQTLFLVIDGQELPEGQRTSAMDLIDPTKKGMRPWTEILRLDREEIYRDARLHLPIWMLIPVVRGIVRILRKMFSTGTTGTAKARQKPARAADARGKTKRSEAKPSSRSNHNPREERRQEFLKRIGALQKEFVNSDESAEQKLKKLRDQWNPLLDPVKRDNLTEDVNSLCRDVLRRSSFVKTLQPPDRGAITELAKRIAGDTTFNRITRRKPFETYLQLYMLTVLKRS